jgi:hypothetical protein
MIKKGTRISTVGVGHADFTAVPEGTQSTVIPISAVDGVSSRGVLYTRGGERTVVVMSHPRGDGSRHYVIPALLEAGYAFYAHQTRNLHNDIDCEHERLLLDLAAGMNHLKNDLGYEKIVFLGNSGGASLLAFYQQQATTTPPGRLTDTAAGEPLDLNTLQMPSADGFILLAAHAGQGAFMLTGIDPSVIDEDDPLAVDPDLDMYNPANGFREPPEPSTYTPEFLERYRAAQHARVARLDARARGLIADQQRYQQRTQEPGFADLPLEERTYITRRALVGSYMIIHRTEADPAYLDLNLHAWNSTRKAASILGPRPDEVNYAVGGFGRVVTPRAWLSTWSGLSTRANLFQSIESVNEPLLVISYTNDNLAFPDDNQTEFHTSPAEDKTMHFVESDHFGHPIDKRQEALRLIVDWLTPRYPGNN